METAFEISHIKPVEKKKRKKEEKENWYFLDLKKQQIFQSLSSLDIAALSLI